MTSVESFYQASATACFVMLGLWWAAMTNRSAGALKTPRARRLALDIHLSFLVPGLMSLAATLSGPSTLLWRSAFVVMTIAGVVAALTIMKMTPVGRGERLSRYLRLASVVVYVVMALLAIRPQLVADIGLDTVTPLQVEGLLLCSLIACGASAAWSFMVAITDGAV